MKLFTTDRKSTIALWIILTAVILFISSSQSPVYILDEARNAQAAREMMERNDWIVPTFNGELRPHKPPLHYYFMWPAYKVFGVSPFAARFFSVIMGLLTLLITWYFTKRFSGKSAAFWSVMILIASSHFLFEFQLAVPDPYLIFFTSAGLFCFFAFIRENRLLWLILSAIALGLASLAKGPVALGLPGICALTWLFFTKQANRLLSWKWILMAIIVAVIALPWYFAVDQATDGVFTKKFFFEQNISRFAEPMEGHGGPFIIMPVIVLLGLLPFSIFSGEASRTKKFFRNPLMSFCLVTGAVFIIFFSISGTKLPNYPMPCYSFLAVILGCWIQKVISGEAGTRRYPLIVLLVLNILLLVAAGVALWVEPATRHYVPWSSLLFIPVITAAVVLYQFRKKGFKWSLQVIITGYLLFNAAMLIFAYPAVYRSNPVTKMMPLIKKGEQLYAWKIYNPAFNFYISKPVKVIETADELHKLISKNSTVKIITREQYLPELDSFKLKVIAKERDLFEFPVSVLLETR